MDLFSMEPAAAVLSSRSRAAKQQARALATLIGPSAALDAHDARACHYPRALAPWFLDPLARCVCLHRVNKGARRLYDNDIVIVCMPMNITVCHNSPGVQTGVH